MQGVGGPYIGCPYSVSLFGRPHGSAIARRLNPIGGLSKIRGAVLEVPRMRTSVFGGLSGVSLFWEPTTST